VRVTTAIILAGGLGTRLRSEVPDLPKPMAPVAGRPFLEHQLGYWIAQGIRHFVLSVGYRHEAVTGHFGSRFDGASIEYVIEETPLGTGGALLLAAQRAGLDQPFLAMNGDTYFAARLESMKQFAQTHGADWCFALFRADEPGRYMGMEVTPEGKITALKTDMAQPGRLANGGVYWIQPRALEKQHGLTGKFSLEDEYLPAALAAGQKLYGIHFDATFIDIGVPADYRRAQQLLANARV
jgi:D-glycero-alpha-D-manno-heptose 1-phosphate guanylyltransferase